MNVTMKERQIEILHEYDVVVLGGGTAGAIAGIASANEGVKTLIIEQFAALGGSQTMALVMPIMPEGMKNGNAESYISKAIRAELTAKGAAYKIDGNYSSWFDTEALKLALEKLAIKAGCDILYQSTLVDVIKEGNAIKAVVVINKGGLQAIAAKQFIDCTGDGDLSVMAGATFEKGDPTGKNQAVSLRFEVMNVDLDAFGEFLEKGGQTDEWTRPPYLSTYKGNICKGFDDFLADMVSQGHLKSSDIKYVQLFSIPGKKGALSFNCPELGDSYNAIEPFYMSQKLCEGKEVADRLIACFQKFLPGFKDCVIDKFASMLGVRESRRINTEYIMKIDDVLNYKKFEDAIAMSDYEIDVHGATTDAISLKKYNKDLPQNEQYFTIPYRSLVVLGIDNLAVAGRCGGFDFYVQSTVRVQHTCRYMGEAAGIGSAMAAKKNCPLKAVDGSEVSARMKSLGADLK